MKTIYAVFASLGFLVSHAAADKICVKGTNPRGTTVQLQRSVVASNKRCPRGAIAIFDTNTLVGNNSITTAAITDGNVTESKLANDAVTSPKLADGAVTTSKISSAGSGIGTVLTSNGAGGVQFSQLTSGLLPSNAALLDRSDQTFTGNNSFPSIQVLSELGNSASAPLGELNKDNIAVAWARVTSPGGYDSKYNISSVTKVSTGRYLIQLSSSVQSGFSLIPLVTPEVDQDGSNLPPTGAPNLRLAVTNQVAAGGSFEVFMYTGQGNLVDNDFQVVVFGR